METQMPTIDKTAGAAVENVVPPKYKAPRPPVGLNVQWFPYGQHRAGCQAATIVGASDGGTVNLFIMKDRGVPGLKRGVWYQDDPTLAKKDHRARISAGTWNYIPGTPKVDLNQPLFSERDEIDALRAETETLKDAVAALEPCGDVSREIQDRIVELSRKDMKSAAIAAEIGGGLTHHKVTAVLRHKGEL